MNADAMKHKQPPMAAHPLRVRGAAPSSQRASRARHNAECRMTNDERMSKPEGPNRSRVSSLRSFGLRFSDLTRHSSFVIRHSASRTASVLRVLSLAAGALLLPLSVCAVDPPHLTADNCAACHQPHQSLGGDLTSVAGNANLCLSCHQPGGTAATTPFVNGDAALPWGGLPVGVAASGSSHRWDSSPAGHLTFLGGAVTPSTGALQPSGVFTGAYAKTYTITIVTAGAVGTARFNWTATSPGGGAGANLLTAASVPLDQGVSLSFFGNTNSAFQSGDRWNLFVLAGLRNATNSLVQTHSANGVVSCSACHDEHSQARAPFDPTAPAFTGPGSGNGRHFMRVNNDHNQLCLDCHVAHNVTNALAGAHPVGIPLPVDATHKLPTRLPLETGTTNVSCLTCHQTHFSLVNDGKLLRLTNSVSVCVDCHTESDTAAAAHFSKTNNATLWPGGRLGSLMPARTTATDRGSCVNCHAVHGWPNATNPTNRYPHLLADFEENLCMTCHGTNGPAAKQVQLDFAKTRRHPIVDTQQVAGRTTECVDCHNPHQARSGGLVYSTTATATRNQVTGPLRGVSGVAVNFTTLTNFQTVATNRYTFIPETTGATYEYQICLKCHSAYAWGTGTPPNGQSPNGTALTPVETDLAQEFSPFNRSGHPIVTGLDNYSNSIVVSGKRGLLAAAMKAPWNVNLGQQTMTCTDCHNTDAASPAAQGPHGSAAQFMLRGTNANNWPNVTLRNIATSWCMNCHNNSAGRGHTEGDHSGYACQVCHLVVQHGGKLSRMLSDHDTMPARYAYNNTRDPLGLQAFTKAAVGSYGESSCRAQCHGGDPHGNRTPNENW